MIQKEKTVKLAEAMNQSQTFKSECKQTKLPSPQESSDLRGEQLEHYKVCK